MKTKRIITLEELEVYKLSMLIGTEIWKIVDNWNYFNKDSFGKQMIRSADSIAANIAEGYGRYTFKENRLFCLYAKGSLIETKCWLNKAVERNLISKQNYLVLYQDLKILHLKLNGYIKYLNQANQSYN